MWECNHKCKKAVENLKIIIIQETEVGALYIIRIIIIHFFNVGYKVNSLKTNRGQLIFLFTIISVGGLEI